MALEEKVSNGIRVLNEYLCGWERRIDLQRLDMASYTKCVLGQLFKSYIEGIEELLGDEKGLDRYDCGFSVPGYLVGYSFDFSSDIDDDYGKLTVEWKRRIEKMLSANVCTT